MSKYPKTVMLKGASVTLASPRSTRESTRSKLAWFAVTILRRSLPFPLSFPRKCAVAFSRGYMTCDEVIPLITCNGFVIVLFTSIDNDFKNFSVLISNRVKLSS